MKTSLKPLARLVKLLPGEPEARRERNRDYLMRLTARNLLLSHYFEAGLIGLPYKSENIHWGWDSPTSYIRGTVVGHWLSAAARIFDETHDEELKARADFIVSEIGRCQKENGGEWAFPIPEKYLYWLKRGKTVWAPQYVCHKNMMGLLDMYKYADNHQAMEILLKCADWFYKFTNDISREQMDKMMDSEETGGMMEYWADLYDVTKDEKHLTLMRRYERPKLFNPIYEGKDVLTNMHANATIPEIQGAARAYEVTGDERYRKIVENYWDLAVRKRGMYATGGQTCGEVWTPMGKQSARLGELNQEHCTVYNMMRLSEYLLRWTGKAEYADYWERNLYNGIFAQGYWQGRSLATVCEPLDPPTGLITYYLPLAAGSQKKWGSETNDFWCCHCTLLQANANHREGIYYQNSDEILLCQYLPSEVNFKIDNVNIKLIQQIDSLGGETLKILPIASEISSRPSYISISIKIKCESPSEFTLKLRSPWWLKGKLTCLVNNEKVELSSDGNGFECIRRKWGDDEVNVILGKALTCWPLADCPNMVAFMDGPIVLAGLTSEERMLYGDIDNPYSMLTPDDDRQWDMWKTGWRTINQPVGIRFKPLYEIGNEVYTVYFPVRKQRYLL
ncbi:MAG TPA: hypothetical protein DD426_09445 [Clostridiaceae bacterium]|nr:hypothetical protein [Clostridiaceae bacterium]